jgi:hypothetical protein
VYAQASGSDLTLDGGFTSIHPSEDGGALSEPGSTRFHATALAEDCLPDLEFMSK